MISASTERKAEHRDLTNEQYHADLTHDSNSSLRLFRKSPNRYRHERITKRITRPATTPEQMRGNASHTALLEPHRLDELVKLIPSEVLSASGAKSGNAWKEWAAANAGLVHLTAEQYDQLHWQVEAVWANPRAKELLEAVTVREYSIFWTTAEGHQVKVRLDAADEIGGVLTDVKRTGRSEDVFHYCVRDFGYGNQAALYSDGFVAMYGHTPVYQLLIIDDEPPFDCRVRTFPQAAIDLGREQNLQTLKDLYACTRGERSWIRPEDHEVRELYLPPWHYARPSDPTEVELTNDR